MCKLKGLYSSKDFFGVEHSKFWFSKQYQTYQEIEKAGEKFDLLTHEVSVKAQAHKFRYFVENLAAKDFSEVLQHENHFSTGNDLGKYGLPNFSQIDPEDIKLSIHKDFLFMR